MTVFIGQKDLINKFSLLVSYVDNKLIFCCSVQVQYLCGYETPLTRNNVELLSHEGFEFGYAYAQNLNCTRSIVAPRRMNVYLHPETFNLELEQRYVFYVCLSFCTILQYFTQLYFSNVYKC